MTPAEKAELMAVFDEVMDAECTVQECRVALTRAEDRLRAAEGEWHRRRRPGWERAK